ncbi:hypothetical protein Q5M85_03410 [Paraclostridium bifermentans]|nr:hypothetical protein [Paraclostridium bifermentans]
MKNIMSKKLEYTATNTGRPFSLTEMVIGASLIQEGYSDKEIKQKISGRKYFSSQK